MISIRSLALILIAFSLSPTWAFDPLRADILTLRLGMTEVEVVGHLAAQGLVVTRGARCDAPDCPPSIEARTRDGTLLIDFASGGRVRRIANTFTGRGVNEDVIIRSAVVDHFGPPSAEAPLAWCRGPLLDGQCPLDQARLVFEPGTGVRGILTLAAASGH
jgi:hypothetical protein